MDRDDTLTTTAATLTAPRKRSAFAQAWDSMAEPLRREIASLEALMREIAGSPKVLPALRAIAARCRGQKGRSLQTLRRHWYAYARHGVAGLVDHRRCGGCGLEGCTWEEAEVRAAAPSAETLRHWAAMDMGNDKRSGGEAWRSLLRDLMDGKAVPGAGTWQDLWVRLRPWAEMPQVCPWSVHRPPPGWSLSSFRAKAGAQVVRALAKKGSFAAWAQLPEVHVDLSTLRPFEWLVVDDHRLDFLVYVDTPTGVQLVELWGLFVMDVATRVIVSFALKPRVQRPDGTCMAFEHADMQHLMAHVLGTYGVPADYSQTWIVENAAAAVSPEAEALVATVTGGRVKVKRSGIQVGDFHLSGFPERWGNYRGKRWIEAWFGPLDIVLGAVKGQMGSDYWAKPGSFDARAAFGRRLTRFLDGVTPEQRQRLTLPFEWAGDAHGLVGDAIELLNHRTDHQLDGFDEVRFFAYDAGSQPMPLCADLARLHGTEQHLEAWQAAPVQVQQTWLSQGIRRRISPAEKMALRRPVMDELSRSAVVDLLCDRVLTQYRGGDVLDAELRRGRKKVKTRFTGALGDLELGQTVQLRFMGHRLECGAWVCDEAGRYITHVVQRSAPTHEDIEGLQRELGTKIKALGEVKRQMHRITLGGGAGERQAAELEALTQAVNLAIPAARVGPTKSPEEAPLVAAIAATRTRRSDGRKPRFQGVKRAETPAAETDEDEFSWE